MARERTRALQRILPRARVEACLGGGRVCPSKPTTYARLDAPNHPGINLIGLRRRSAEVMDEGHRTPPSAWRRIAPEGVSRTSKHPRSLDRRIALLEGRRRPPAAVGP